MQNEGIYTLKWLNAVSFSFYGKEKLYIDAQRLASIPCDV